MKRIFPFVAALLGVCTIFGASTAHADSIDDFYKGKQIKYAIASTPGGGYDIYARAVARHLGDHLPGNPSVVPQNVPGAGGIKAAELIYAVAPKDGLTIGAMQNTVPFEPMYGNTLATFDPLKFSWLGSPTKEVAFLFVWYTVPVNSLEDAKHRELILGAAGAASTPAFYSRVLATIFDLKIKLITGYPGQTEAFLAMEKGENEGYGSTFWSSLKTVRPDWIRDKKVKILVQYALEPHPELKDVPFAQDLITDPDDRQLMDVASAPLALGRPMAAPPGIPADRLALLKTAMAATFADPAFRADCEKQRLECDAPVTGEQIQTILEKSYAAPKPILNRLRDIYNAGGGAN
jgi:tripartite-type tricarboxylate transporter receptor subunit TctC